MHSLNWKFSITNYLGPDNVCVYYGNNLLKAANWLTATLKTKPTIKFESNTWVKT